MISKKLSLREMIESISDCGFYEMIDKINMEATEAERISIRGKRVSDIESPEKSYAKELKELINFLRYDVYPDDLNTKNGILFSLLKRNLESVSESGHGRINKYQGLPN